MKVISLNTWGARAGKENLLVFFRKYKDVDVFCLQEIWEGGDDEAPKWGAGIDTRMLTNIGSILKDHSIFFYPHYHDWYGLAMFVKKDISAIEEGDIFVHKDKGWVHEDFHANHARNLQYMTIETSNGPKTILNFHGLWNGGPKEDTEERIIQSDRIAKFVENIPNPYVLMGDFNLLPETKSLKMLEDLGLRNLIKEFGITSTRSSHYTKPARFADYTLVSKDIRVNDFKVLPDEVSDHLAMYLDFE
jgi:endonuclease/exonuclease/phosphatase family metal-dependent hydrolase